MRDDYRSDPNFLGYVEGGCAEIKRACLMYGYIAPQEGTGGPQYCTGRRSYDSGSIVRMQVGGLILTFLLQIGTIRALSILLKVGDP